MLQTLVFPSGSIHSYLGSQIVVSLGSGIMVHSSSYSTWSDFDANNL